MSEADDTCRVTDGRRAACVASASRERVAPRPASRAPRPQRATTRCRQWRGDRSPEPRGPATRDVKQRWRLASVWRRHSSVHARCDCSAFGEALASGPAAVDVVRRALRRREGRGLGGWGEGRGRPAAPDAALTLPRSIRPVLSYTDRRARGLFPAERAGGSGVRSPAAALGLCVLLTGRRQNGGRTRFHSLAQQATAEHADMTRPSTPAAGLKHVCRRLPGNRLPCLTE